MRAASRHPPELLKYGGREYLVYEVANHVTHPPTVIGVRLERHMEPRYTVFCTGRFTVGELRHVRGSRPEDAASAEEREMIRLFDSSPELQNYVRGWIVHCYRRYSTPDALEA